jgi:hypothetical protein
MAKNCTGTQERPKYQRDPNTVGNGVLGISTVPPLLSNPQAAEQRKRRATNHHHRRRRRGPVEGGKADIVGQLCCPIE